MPRPYAIELGATERVALRPADAPASAGDGSNAVGRTLAELEILISPLLAGDATQSDHDLRRWPLRQTVGFIIVSCGIFWTAAALAAWSLL